MKRIILTCIICCLSVLSFGCTNANKNITFKATIENVYKDNLMVLTSDSLSFDRASVDVSAVEKTFNYAIGQEVEITIKPEIRESYPVMTTAIKIKLLKDSQQLVKSYQFIRTSDKADLIENLEYFENYFTLAISSARHILVKRIINTQELAELLSKITNIDTPNNQPLKDALKQYDETYFKDRLFIFVYLFQASGTTTYYNKDVIKIAGNSKDNSTHCFIISNKKDGPKDAEAANWFGILEIDKKDLLDTTKIDAILE